MGTQTFGKGSVQTIIELEDGAGLKLTVARYYTPKHRSIQERGITPDVPVAESRPSEGDPRGLAESDLRHHLVNEQSPATPAAETPQTGQGGGERKDDPQLDRAIDLLRAARVFRGGTGASP
jgi:carboxyl-terminal processing protease